MKTLLALMLSLFVVIPVLAQSYVGSGDTYPTRDTLVVKNLAVTSRVNLPANSISNSALPANIAVANITNALKTGAASIGGNLPVAAITNALAGTAYTTNTLTGDGKTNMFIWNTVGGVKVLKSITLTE